MEAQCVKPQIRDHSKRVPTSKDFTRSTGLSISSNIRELRSLQINHIRQTGIIFQTFEEKLPKQLLHANRREATVFGITH